MKHPLVNTDLYNKVATTPGLVMLDGPRGAGKTYLLEQLEVALKSEFRTSYRYKTFKDQKDLGKFIQLGYDISQATPYVLDFVAQVPQLSTVLCDRSFVSSLVYNRDEAILKFAHFMGLMERTNSLLIMVEAGVESMVQRLISREGQVPEGHDVRKDYLAYRQWTRIIRDKLDPKHFHIHDNRTTCV